MKPVLLVLAVILACTVYEIDREARITWHPDVSRALDIAPQDGLPWGWEDHSAGSAGVLPAPREAGTRGRPTGQVEREHSIRLFGPGVSRRQQIRV